MIYLFGSTGMLGNYVKIILSKNYDIKCITRKKYDILNESFEKLNKLLCNLNDNDIVINCAGIIPQKTKNNDYSKFIKINTLFPHKLQNIVEKFNAKLIHISTDCVFNGEKGDSYDENDAHTETKIYGISKSLGEPENTTIIRTSIIGEEIKGKKGLIGQAARGMHYKPYNKLFDVKRSPRGGPSCQGHALQTLCYSKFMR